MLRRALGAHPGACGVMAGESVGETTLRAGRVAVRFVPAVPAAPTTPTASVTSLAEGSQGRALAVRLTAISASTLETQDTQVVLDTLTQRYPQSAQHPPP